MSYQEKRIVMNLILGILLPGAYGFFAFNQYQSGAVQPGDLKFWALSMLIFIGSAIAVTIIAQILFHIFLAISIAIKEREKDEAIITKTIEATVVEDEMDQLIELKSSKVGFFFSGLGFVAALIFIALGHKAETMLLITFFSFSLGALLEGFLSLYYYKKGIHNG